MQAPQALQDLEESQDSKGRLAMLASLDRRVILGLQVQAGHQEDQDMRAILDLQGLRGDLDPLATLVLRVQLGLQDPLALQEWV